MVNMLKDTEFRSRLIERVEALRAAALMCTDEFNARVGPPAAKSWAKFVAADARDPWSHLSVGTLERIAEAFEIAGSDMLSFKS
jgi:hypothetical protein